MTVFWLFKMSWLREFERNVLFEADNYDALSNLGTSIICRIHHLIMKVILCIFLEILKEFFPVLTAING